MLCLIQSVSAKLATPEGVDARGCLSIRLKLVLVLGVCHHALRVIQHSAAVRKATLEDQAVVDANVIVDTSIVPGAVLTERVISLGHHFRVDFLVALANRLVFVHIVQSDHCRRIPIVIVTFLNNCLGMGRLERLYDVFGVNATASHCLATYLLQCLEQPVCPLGTICIFGHLLNTCVKLGDVQPQLPLVQQLSQ